MSDSNNNNQDQQNAIDLVNNLINGINPITKSRFEMETIFSSPEIVRALFFIRNILNNEPLKDITIERKDNRNRNMSERLNLRAEKFDLDEIDFSDFNFDENLGIVKFVKKLNEYLKVKEIEFEFESKTIISWLENEGFLTTENENSKKHIPSQMGEALGINFKDINISGNMVKMCIYNKKAQSYIIEHIQDIYL